MERRVLLAILLSFLVLYAYQALLGPVPSEPPPAAPTTSAGSAASPDATQPASRPRPSASDPASAGPQAGRTALVGETAEREIRFETDRVIAVFTNRGARLKSWALKRYLDTKGQPLELVPFELSATEPLPFSLEVDDNDLTAVMNGALYAASQGPEGNQGRVTFEYRDSSGLHVVKEFEIEPEPYLLGFRAAVSVDERPLQPAIAWGPALASSGAEPSSYVRQPGGLLFTDGGMERLTTDAITAQPAYDGDFRYAGVDDHYFISAVVNPGTSKVTFRPVTAPPPAGSQEVARHLVAYTVTPANADAGIRVFAGPKDFDLLAAIDRELVRAIDFGMFSAIVVPLLRALNWINGFIGNYGWSIVALTILINAAMFPLRHKSVVSMRKMQEIQPEAKAIQDRYAKLKATDPARQKMNQELMALYRERGVNPASGCLPMLLTLPVLLAFYSLLTVSIELRGAPFAGWIHDLSLPDPLYITPVLMGATQIWQTWLTPQTGVDPAQQKMMMLMPIMFMVFFLWAPAGVVLYWFVSNLWAIGQQYLTNYLIGPPNVRTVRPPAERRIKQAGSSKSEAAQREN
jgi:YidC/Oxa1 family membrane protein insertase